MSINLDLAAKMNLTQNEITAIEVLHKKLDAFLKRPLFYVEAKDVVDMVEAYELVLQACWGFPLDKGYHRYWFMVEGCTCPRDDNKMLVATGAPYRCYNNNCPYHGKHYD